MQSPVVADLASSVARGFLLASYLSAQALVLLVAGHRALVLWRWRLGRRPSLPDAAPALGLPIVTVQLPIFDERRVVERLIDAVAALRYPADRLEIQVLDDSTDETTELARRAVARHHARGVDIRLLHRDRRDGYKAGALAAGLACARGEILVVFDADFVPGEDFLERVVPPFADTRVGMVQARWGHLNRDRSRMTAAQAAMLDAHFLLEHETRMAAGLFFNFNGTAGAWRRACIESSGGWQHDTLTEDLDLSYRAQLAGWRFVFDRRIEARAELPADFGAFRSQQRRWVQGSVQTARKLLPRILAAALPWRVRLEAFFHLTANFAYPLALLLGLLTPPLLLLPFPGGWRVPALVENAVLLLAVTPMVLCLIAGQWAQCRAPARGAADVLAALVLAAGLSVNNTRAVLAGFRRRLGDWERTPKTGDGAARAGAPPYARSRAPGGRTELLLAVYFALSVVAAASRGHLRSLPFLLLFAFGFGWVGWGSSHPSARGKRRKRRNEKHRSALGEAVS